MPKPSPRLVEVTKTSRISPSVQRVHLGGEALRTFPSTTPGAYVKLMFDLEGQPLTAMVDKNQVAMRTYTVNSYNPSVPEMTIDMVLHASDGATGPASAWAGSTKPGDTILIAGPGSSKGLSETYHWVLLAGDMTALPSIKNHLAALPKNTRGYAVIVVETEDDIVDIPKPESIDIVWETKISLPEAVANLSWYDGLPAVWVACEFSDMRNIRRWLQDEKKLPHEQLYISSYWKKGRSEDQHKIDKRQDSEAFVKTLKAD
jgi:NADPH-dependent ferric siderophore reductase